MKKVVFGSIREGSMTTFTQWFSNENPVHIGGYEWHPSNDPSQSILWHWNGSQWGFFARDSGSYIKCWTQIPRWRGLAVKPKSGISSV